MSAPVAPGGHAIGARVEPLAGSGQAAWLIGGEYLQVRPRLSWGVHTGGIYEEFPPEDPVLGIGGTVAYTGLRWICPALSVTGWSPHVDLFSQVPGDSDLSVLLFRMGVGLARASGDSLRLVAWLHPHITVARTHSTFGELDATDSETEFFTDLGGAIAGGRFWGSLAARFQFADDPGEDIPLGGAWMVRGGVRF